ncbi:exopolysaccharide biosynthesis protein [Paracoccus laeviglucosivorans]|uniref:Uncharacterized conserved protein n=1 Tax=Paracoccus laeviglucosivorans TaxID=1197861 RepID=A0A521EX30_9RHOB|nr:exopolysaccharide biosynthesis protein [Paracoccus laeviglucosivorans]SMO88467.1 Uncharacterized conserved protein [Paracoccus laeviglucosivorans]
MIDDSSDKSEPSRRRGLGEVDPVIPIADEPEPEPGQPRRQARKSLSQRLTQLANDETRERIAMADLLTLMPGQALAALVLIFAAPNVVPGPPGLSAILGLPMVYLTFQLMLGRTPWLPPVIAQRTFARGDFAALVLRIAPLLARLEKLLRPRVPALVNYNAERAVGAFCFLLAIIILMPVPLGNMLPALAISLMMLGLLERDGLWVGIGAVTGALSLIVVAGVIYAMIKAVIFLFSRVFLG